MCPVAGVGSVVEYAPEGHMSLQTQQMKKAEKLLSHGYEEALNISPAKEIDKVRFNPWGLPVRGIKHAQTYGPRIKVFRRVVE
jgi:hypothetical protein